METEGATRNNDAQAEAALAMLSDFMSLLNFNDDDNSTTHSTVVQAIKRAVIPLRKPWVNSFMVDNADDVATDLAMLTSSSNIDCSSIISVSLEYFGGDPNSNQLNVHDVQDFLLVPGFSLGAETVGIAIEKMETHPLLRIQDRMHYLESLAESKESSSTDASPKPGQGSGLRPQIYPNEIERMAGRFYFNSETSELLILTKHLPKEYDIHAMDSSFMSGLGGASIHQSVFQRPKVRMLWHSSAGTFTEGGAPNTLSDFCDKAQVRREALVALLDREYFRARQYERSIWNAKYIPSIERTLFESYGPTVNVDWTTSDLDPSSNAASTAYYNCEPRKEQEVGRLAEANPLGQYRSNLSQSKTGVWNGRSVVMGCVPGLRTICLKKEGRINIGFPVGSHGKVRRNLQQLAIDRLSFSAWNVPKLVMPEAAVQPRTSGCGFNDLDCDSEGLALLAVGRGADAAVPVPLQRDALPETEDGGRKCSAVRGEASGNVESGDGGKVGRMQLLAARRERNRESARRSNQRRRVARMAMRGALEAARERMHELRARKLALEDENRNMLDILGDNRGAAVSRVPEF